MREVGEVLHKARSGRLIIRLSEKKLEPGALLLDAKGRKAAKVLEVIGPVAAPCASAAPASEREGTKGQKLFLA